MICCLATVISLEWLQLIAIGNSQFSKPSASVTVTSDPGGYHLKCLLYWNPFFFGICVVAHYIQALETNKGNPEFMAPETTCHHSSR